MNAFDYVATETQTLADVREPTIRGRASSLAQAKRNVSRSQMFHQGTVLTIYSPHGQKLCSFDGDRWFGSV